MEFILEQQKSNKYLEIHCVDKKLWIRLNKTSLDYAIDLCKKTGKIETGGVITGYYSKSGITCTIDSLHSPTEDSEHEYSSFVSGVKGLAELFKKLWIKQEYYIGEWHFHPENLPTPSRQDKSQLKEIAEKKNFHCKFPLMLIVGQKKDNYCYSITGYSSSSKYVKFITES